MADIRKTGLLDTLAGTAESPLSRGGNWNFSGVVGAPLDLVGTGATHQAGAGTGSSYWTPQSFPGDVEVWARPNAGGADGIAWALELLQTTGASNADGYRARQEVQSGGNSITIYRIDNSVTTGIYGTGGGFSVGTSTDLCLFRFIAATNTLELWYSTDSGANWTLQLSGNSDTTYSGPFYLSLGIRDNSNSQILAWNNFGGGNKRNRPQIYRIIRGQIVVP